jgi:hypothetical protein
VSLGADWTFRQKVHGITKTKGKECAVTGQKQSININSVLKKSYFLNTSISL